MATGIKVFYKSVIKQMQTTGSIAPSSPYLANAITSCVERKESPLRILEAGPGTGPFTRVLVKRMGPQDHLDLCELNPFFAEYLGQLCRKVPILCAHRHQIDIHQKPVQALEGESCYDYIISGLPLNNFDPALVQDIFNCFERLIKPGGKLAFFEYYMIRNLKRSFVNQCEKQRIREREKILAGFLNRYEEKRIIVPMNLPPSMVYVCQFPQT